MNFLLKVVEGLVAVEHWGVPFAVNFSDDESG